LADLGDVSEIGSGGQGIVYSVSKEPAWAHSGPLVYKEYRRDPGSGFFDNLAGIVRMRARLPHYQRAALDAATAWPLCLVVDEHGDPTGVVMPRIASRFYATVQLPSGREKTIPREIQPLFAAPARADKIGLDVPAGDDTRTRLQLCARLADAFALLHEVDIVYGDLSSRNVLYDAAPTPSVLLIDCDGASLASGVVPRYMETPDWGAPEMQRSLGYRPSVNTDRYKLALFVLRCMTPGDRSSINRDPAVASSVLDTTGFGLLRNALEGPPYRRPSAREWSHYLGDVLDEGGAGAS
jgi:hypothetical protein